MNKGKVSWQTCVAVTPILRAVAAGTLEFRRRGYRWEQVEIYESVCDPLAWQEKAVRVEDWNSGRCRSCAGWSYTLVMMGNRLWYLCNQCRPWQTDGTGARPVKVQRRRRIGPTSSSGEAAWRESHAAAR
jgi:hypothetical protein